MFKCLCCSGRHRREDGGGRSHKFSLENVQAAAEASTASDRYLRKKLDDDHRADRFDGPPPIQRPAAEIGGGAGVRSSGGKGHRPAAPVQKQAAPPPPPPPAPIPVVAVKQQVNLPHPDKGNHTEEPASIVEEVLSVRVEQKYTVEKPQPSEPPQPPSAPKSSSVSSEEDEEEQKPPPPPPPLQKSHRQPQDRLHGSTVFQSDENETTIVDSDYSDYEDDEEKLRPAAESGHAARTTATLSVILPRRHSNRDEDDEEHQLKAAAERLSTFLLAEEGDDDDGSAANSGWQTLPNSLRSRGGHLTHHQPLLETLVEEEPIGVNAPQPVETETDDDEEVVVPVQTPPPPPPPPQQQQHLPVETQQQQQLSIDDDPSMARESLLALDQALAVFELASSYDEPTDFAAHSHAHAHAAVNGFDELPVEEEIIQPSPQNS